MDAHFPKVTNRFMMHWSKSQSNVALSSAEAELNATVKGLSELIGLYHLIEETQRVTVNLVLRTDASACKGMLLRHGTGKVKHLSVKQLWAQECVRAYDVTIQRVPREKNPSDVLTHSVSHPTMEKQLERLNVRRGRLLNELYDQHNYEAMNLERCEERKSEEKEPKKMPETLKKPEKVTTTTPPRGRTESFCVGVGSRNPWRALSRRLLFVLQGPEDPTTTTPVSRSSMACGTTRMHCIR